MFMVKMSFLCVLSLSLTLPRTIRAQKPAEEAERLRELVLAMVSWITWDRKDLELREGELPDLPEGLRLPEDATILGSFVHQDGFITFLGLEGGLEKRLEAVEAALVESDWNRLEDDALHEVGFVGERRFETVQLFRGAEELLSLSSPPRRAGGGTLRIEYSESSPMCDPPQSPWTRARRVPFPALAPPASAETIGHPTRSMGMRGWGGAREDDFRSELQLEVDLPPTALIEHYGSEIEAAGWTVEQKLEGERGALGTWTLEGEAGSWRAVLYAVESGPGKYDLVLRAVGTPTPEISNRADTD